MFNLGFARYSGETPMPVSLIALIPIGLMLYGMSMGVKQEMESSK